MVERTVKFFWFWILVSFCCCSAGDAQKHYRIAADIKIKTIEDSKIVEDFEISMRCDINYNMVVVRLGDGVVQTVTDSMIFYYVNDNLLFKNPENGGLKKNILYMALTGKLNDFEGANSTFMPTSVVSKNNKTIATYKLKNEFADTLKSGSIIAECVCSFSDNKIDAIANYNKNGEIVSKQYYLNYKNFKGIFLPTQIVVDYEMNGKHYYSRQIFENIIIDEEGNDFDYNYMVN